MSRAKLDLVRPSAAKAPAAVSRAAERLELGEARLVVQMAVGQHQLLKAHAAAMGKSLRDYVLEVLERAGAFRE